MFVLVNVGLHDGLQTSFTSKFVYGLWRPVTAIRRADEDLNPDTDPDPTWTPLLTTPPYPSYAGNAACLSAAAARALQLAFGRDDVPFSVTWPRTMGLPQRDARFHRLLAAGRPAGTKSHPRRHPLTSSIPMPARPHA